jgi:hypothetical protein
VKDPRPFMVSVPGRSFESTTSWHFLLLSHDAVNTSLIHQNEWQIMLKTERNAKNFQMACSQHFGYAKTNGNLKIINLFSAFYARISKSFRTFAPENNNRVPNMAEAGKIFSVGVQG